LPKAWPNPIYLKSTESGQVLNRWDYHGYAGGLGPDNLEEQIPRILEAASYKGFSKEIQEGDIWIDMETKVRSDQDRQFDLEKVEHCLEIAAPHIKIGEPVNA
jgi:hypothetical protein